MSRWLDAYFAQSSDVGTAEKKTANAPYDEPTKLTKPSSVGFVSPSERQFVKNSAPSDPPRYPFFYTDSQREAARRDAERLGYGRGRTIH